MRTLGKGAVVGLVAMTLAAAGCGAETASSTAEAPVSTTAEATAETTDTTAATATSDERLVISIPEGWTIVSPEAGAPADQGEAPEDLPKDVVCPDGSTPRAPLQGLKRVAVANAPSGELVVFQSYEYGSDAEALEALSAWGTGKCEVVLVTTEGEDSTFPLFIDEEVAVAAASGLDTVAVLMVPDNGSDPNGVMLVASGKDVVLIAVVGGDATQLEAVLNLVAAQY